MDCNQSFQSVNTIVLALQNNEKLVVERKINAIIANWDLSECFNATGRFTFNSNATSGTITYHTF